MNGTYVQNADEVADPPPPMSSPRLTVTSLPDAQLGVGVFTNAYFSERHAFESLFYAFALAMHTVDTALGSSPADWSTRFEEALSRASGARR